MNLKLLANTYLALALLLGALLPVMLSIASSTNISLFLFYAYSIGAVVSLLVIVSSGRKDILLNYLKNRNELAKIAGIGLLNYAFLEYGLTFAEKFISASLATAVYRTYPLLMLAFLPSLLRERITKYQIAAICLGIAGIYFALTGGNIGLLLSSNAYVVLFVVGIAIASAIATVLVKKYSFDMITGMFIFNLANAAFFGVAFLAAGGALNAFSMAQIVALLYTGIVYNVFVGFMYYSAFRMLKSAFVANIYFLSPFVTFLYAYALLGEAIKPYYIAIAALVAVGIVIQKFDRPATNYVRKQRHSHTLLFDVTSAFVNTKRPEIQNVISKGGRVLALNAKANAVKGMESTISNIKEADAFIYTDAHEIVSEDERAFIREIVGADEEDRIIMCAGPVEKSEELLDRLASISGLEINDEAGSKKV